MKSERRSFGNEQDLLKHKAHCILARYEHKIMFDVVKFVRKNKITKSLTKMPFQITNFIIAKFCFEPWIVKNTSYYT
jgi:hypothetical protein